MKKIVLLILICFATPARSQYHSLLGVSQTSWNISSLTVYGYLTDSLFISGDTLWNGVNYKIVESLTVDATGGIVLGNGIYGFLREDTVNGKAWFRKIFNTSEYLFYDMSLSVNDSFFVTGFPGSNYDVDSVYIANNLKHVRVAFHYMSWGFHYFNENLTFIEGLSTNYGFHYDQNDPVRADPVLLCVYKDNQIVYQQNYQDPFYTGCNTFFPLGISMSEQANLFSLFPNPNNGMIVIRNSIVKSSTIVIKNMQGVVVKTAPVLPGSETAVNIEELSPGIYFCFFDLNPGNIKKLIKTR